MYCIRPNGLWWLVGPKGYASMYNMVIYLPPNFLQAYSWDLKTLYLYKRLSYHNVHTVGLPNSYVRSTGCPPKKDTFKQIKSHSKMVKCNDIRFSDISDEV